MEVITEAISADEFPAKFFSAIFAQDILPYSRLKQAQLECFLQARSLVRKGPKPIPEDIIHKRYAVVERLQDLRRR